MNKLLTAIYTLFAACARIKNPQMNISGRVKYKISQEAERELAKYPVYIYRA